MRARIILGSDAIAQTFNAIRFNVLKHARDTAELQMDVRDMRLKMRENLSQGDARHMHLKNDAGGIADIEFMVQYIVLACAADHPELMAFPDNIRILEAASNTGLVNADECAMLQRNYLLMRDLIHRQALQQQQALVEIDEAVTIGRNEVIALWQRLIES